MSNNHSTGDLFTGMHSLQARQVQAQRKERREKNTLDRAAIGAEAADVLAIIQEERKLLPQKLWDIITPNDTKETLQASKNAMLLYDTYLVKLHNRISIITNKAPVTVDELLEKRNEN